MLVEKNTLRAIITDLCPKFKTLCIWAAKTLRSRPYIKVYDIGTGRSQTPLIPASQVVAYSVFFNIWKGLPESLLIADSKTVLIWSFKQAISNIDPKGKVRELATAGLNLVRSQILNCDYYVWLNKLPERRPIGIRVAIFKQAGPILTPAQIVNCDVLVFEKAY